MKKAKTPTETPMTADPLLAVVDINEIKLFANWLWDLDLLNINNQLPPFYDADKVVDFYKKARIEPRKYFNDERTRYITMNDLHYMACKSGIDYKNCSVHSNNRTGCFQCGNYELIKQ